MMQCNLNTKWDSVLELAELVLMLQDTPQMSQKLYLSTNSMEKPSMQICS